MRKLSLGLETFIYGVMWAIIIAVVIVMIFNVSHNFSNMLQDEKLLEYLGTIFAVCSGIAVFIANNKKNRLNHSIHLVEKFDNEEFCKARDLTRRLSGKEDKVSNNVLLKLIKYMEDDNNKNEDVIKLMKQCKFSDDDCKRLERSVIYTFNYWQQVYNGIMYNAADEKYLREHLSDVYVSQYKRFDFWIENLSDKKMEKDLRALHLLWTN